MNEHQILKYVFGILLSLGTVVLWMIAFLCFYKYLLQEKKCTSQVKGTVKKYTLFSHGGKTSSVNLPVVFYTVNGKQYKVVGPEYRAIKTLTKTSPVAQNSMEVYEDNQTLTVKRTKNAFIGIFKNPMEELYPLNSQIDVYYDPENPKLAYVLRYCNRKWAFWLTFLSGVAVLGMDIMTFLLVR